MARTHHMQLILTTVAVVAAVSPVFAVDVQREIIDPAEALVGRGYCTQGTGPRCFDCSGFVVQLYRPFVPDLPRVSRDMARVGAPVDRGALRAGDLVFFATGGRATVITHVAIYAGNDTLIHAISDGPNRGVTITPLSARYWSTRYHSARRVLPASVAAPAAEVEERSFALGDYSGDLVDGEPDGTGTLRMANGDRYEGSFDDGQFDGPGTYTWADGTTATGTWKDGELLAAPPQTRETYGEVARSPWDEFDGIVRGDFDAWRAAEEREFEAWQRENSGR